MVKRINLPVPGDRIRHYPELDDIDDYYQGEVDWVGASQFAYIADDPSGERRYASFASRWEVITGCPKLYPKDRRFQDE